MKRVAAPVVGGLVTSFLLELLVHPAICLETTGPERGTGDGDGTTPELETVPA